MKPEIEEVEPTFVASWNLFSPDGSYLRPSPLPRITTELKVIASQPVSLTYFIGQVPELENQWASALVKSLELKHDLLPVAELSWNPISLNFATELNKADVQPSPKFLVSLIAPSHLAGTAQPSIQLKPVVQLQIGNTFSKTWSKMSNSLTAPPETASKPPRAALLWQEVAMFLRMEKGQLSEEARKKREQIASFLEDFKNLLDSLLQPAPHPRPVPVFTSGRGAVRTRGPIRERGISQEQKPVYISALVLDESWEEERALSLPVLDGPTIQEGRLSLKLRVEDTALASRVADLVLITETFEVALCSAKARSRSKVKGATLSFSVDLQAAGITVRDGAIPSHVLHVIFEPVSAKPRRRPRSSPRSKRR